MAKAALNMMTRTSAQDYSEDNIYMNAVDTGWITDENPIGVDKMCTPPPLDEWDAAMRILDPLLAGENDPSNRHYGIFYKNYKPTKW
ncbi:hypothetical protein HK102_007602 [Quaeritorhiza haematococci]|nr:hypothetical protein HK102_007602 [Quaeritorhiza haematococci]